SRHLDRTTSRWRRSRSCLPRTPRWRGRKRLERPPTPHLQGARRFSGPIRSEFASPRRGTSGSRACPLSAAERRYFQSQLPQVFAHRLAPACTRGRAEATDKMKLTMFGLRPFTRLGVWTTKFSLAKTASQHSSSSQIGCIMRLELTHFLSRRAGV